MRIVTAADVLAAVKELVSTRLPLLVAEMGWEDELGSVSTWDQVPTIEALSRGDLPAGAVASPGLAEEPTTNRDGTTATWRVAVGIYNRGEDWTDTSTRCQRWAGLIRAAVLSDPTLGGIAQSTAWKGEEYAEVPARNSAQTLAGCAVAFNVTVKNVVDTSTPPAGHPLVESTHQTVTVRPARSST